ncbi:kinesin-like protein KIN-14K [Gossypium arboreum]|uniref:kinesin-like protein KIN-14K n=1 Tax=Gossypium arboreum TaxID=29729 RepID=UPI0022F1DA20|nr:kinesin-like protein KIN-14K [Gossypium arboreum]
MSPQSYAKQREIVIQWLNTILPDLRLPTEASDEELRACLIDGTVLCRILNRLSPSSPNEESSENSSVSQPENVKRFLATMDELGIPRFEVSDLGKGSMKTVVYCLLSLKLHFISSGEELSTLSTITKAESTNDDGSSPGSLQQFFGEEMRNAFPGLKLQCAMHNQVISEPSPAVLKHVGHKFHEVFQLKQACYADLPVTKILEMMESNSLESAPTQALLNVVYGILDETAETMNGKIPHHVACLLRKAVQEMGQRLSTQADHLRTQNNLYRADEEKHRSKIKELEALVSVSRKETKHVTVQPQQIRSRRKKNISWFSASTLLKCFRPTSQTANSKLEEQEVEKQELMKLVKENEKNILELAAMRQELDIVGMVHKFCSLEMEAEAKAAIAILQLKIKELECLLADSNNKVKELEASFESKCQSWIMKEKIYQSFIHFQFEAMQKLRSSSEAIKQEVLETQKRYSFELNHLESKLKAVTDAAGNYHEVLKENHKLFSELQDLKGNIRVYCRIRPFLPGQTEKLSTIENISENGQLVIANPSKPGKDGQRSFKFNKIFGPDATQGEVFADIQPFVKSVVDGYNVCIFAYGQTGSGKTYTMTGPTGATEEEWGVNYLALNHLFKVSQDRKCNTVYEVAVQMVEIYNEQVRDLLSSDGSPKRVGITTISQPNGLAVPEACMHPVISTSDVLDLMDIGFKNRAVSATALNARSSRSHSIVTVHVRGRNVKTGTVLYGNLHLIDLAGSERVDRSEVTGHRLREAQHINKSLSSLGDVIFALAKKSPHVPYRNSKLTQVLQSSLGGQAKTIMLVQLNPDATSFSESMSTLKFAERVSGVELGAAQSSKEEKDVRELLEQMASLKDKIAEKDEEIRRLKSLRDLKPRIPQQQQL